MTDSEAKLKTFQAENNVYTKGPLSLVIQFTRLVRERTFPLNPAAFSRRWTHKPWQHGFDD